MSLIVAGTVRVAPEKLEALRPHAIDMIRASREEKGCIAYAFSNDLAQPGLIHVFEVWRDAKSLEAHGASEHMKTWRAAAGALGLAERRLKTYEIASEKERP
ncbi:MAG: antibiotic biosynthesis monooxygenase [Caulobacteraceae bacterium]|nr:antibiotic biosynthesis monooxygenase [Caulobacteraceae bacterium]